MKPKAEALLEEALELSERERAEIAGALLESLEPPLDPEVDQAWREEVARRVAQLEAGGVETIPWEQVRDQLWARLSEARRR
ncbi:MAG: addiction module protein [Acidobacteria bacterium]|nr:addiction module protein [Acidobacteriota bacterium]